MVVSFTISNIKKPSIRSGLVFLKLVKLNNYYSQPERSAVTPVVAAAPVEPSTPVNNPLD